jgi:D-amino-acid dehydrogenase
VHIAIIGAGITGVATAHALAAGGHAVTVFERRHSVAAEGSFAPSGLCTAFAPLPWGVPGIPRRLLARWLGPNAALRMGSAGAALRWGWWWQHWRASGHAPGGAGHAALQALARASRQRLAALQAELGLSYEQEDGVLVLLPRTKDAQRVRQALGDGAGDGAGDAAPRWVDADTCRQLEPNLSAKLQVAGGLRLPDSGVGNARQLAHQLKAAAQRLGARFEFDATVHCLHPGDAPEVETAAEGRRKFDAVVVCAGAGSAGLLARAGLRVPLGTIHRFALTAPLALLDGQGHTGPRSGVVEARTGMAVARIGERVRITGVAACGGSLDRQMPWAMETLHRALEALYPGAAVGRRAQQWGDARALVPDGAPLIGRSALPGVWLNTAHGGTGWAVACGSAQWLAAMLSGEPAEGPMAWLGPDRLR